MALAVVGRRPALGGSNAAAVCTEGDDRAFRRRGQPRGEWPVPADGPALSLGRQRSTLMKSFTEKKPEGTVSKEVLHKDCQL
jgi:hypothetical protein